VLCWRKSRIWLCSAVAVAALVAGADPGGALPLPDNRGYELVSPPDKNGGDVLAVTARTRAASDGNALGFASLAGFSDVIGTGVDVDYMSVRTGMPGTSGWSTHAITPQQGPQSFIGIALGNLQPLYLGDYSADLSRGVLRTWRTVTEAPNVEDVPNLYLRTDLRVPGDGNYELVSQSDTVQPLQPLFQGLRPVFAGASSDFNHVIFESILNLTAGAAGSQPKLYEWANGSTRLVGILPDGTVATRAVAGLGASQRYTERTISADGSRIFFSVPSTGQVYARIEGSASVQLSTSEQTSPESPGFASFGSASTDGSRVFFVTSEGLVDADTNGTTDIYMWKQGDHDEKQELTVDATDGTFTLGLYGQTTEAIAFDAPADAVRAALAALPGVGGPGNVDVNGSPGAGGPNAYQVRFKGALSGVNVPQLTTDPSGLTGGAASATVDTTDPVTNLSLLSRDEAAPDNPGELNVIGASVGGDYVYFAALGQLIDGEPEFGTGAGLYVWHEGALSYIGWLTVPSDAVLNTPATPWISVGATKTSRVSPDGRFLLFMSHTDDGLRGRGGFPGADHGNTCDYDQGSGPCRELYLFDAKTGALECASCNAGAAAAGDALLMHRSNSGGSPSTNHLSHALSDDGQYVFFATRDALVSQDVNGKLDVYEYDASSGTQRLLSSGTSPSDSFLMDASSSGHDVFFLTRDRLVGWDVDTNYDVYDARSDGGMPEPAELRGECVGDACQGPPSPPPAADTNASTALRGAGDVVPKLRPRHRPRRCRHAAARRLVRGKRKCVRTHKRRHAHTRRAK